MGVDRKPLLEVRPKHLSQWTSAIHDLRNIGCWNIWGLKMIGQPLDFTRRYSWCVSLESLSINFSNLETFSAVRKWISCILSVFTIAEDLIDTLGFFPSLELEYEGFVLLCFPLNECFPLNLITIMHTRESHSHTTFPVSFYFPVSELPKSSLVLLL